MRVAIQIYNAIGILTFLLALDLQGTRRVLGARSGVPACNAAGPNADQVAQFMSQLSSPSALVYQPSYQYAAGLITDGLSNGTEPVYVLPTPSFVVIPSTAEDVVIAVQFAADYCLKVAALGTGHQLAGLALPAAGMTIKMQNFRDINFDTTTNIATVGMGSPSGLVAEKLLPYGRLAIVGTCQGVGVAGFALQGGDGWASQWHGAGADFVQSLDVVVVGPDRKAVRKNVTAQSDPDLFFGFRGAGGNLGVAISYTTATFPTPAKAQRSYYSISIDRAEEVLLWWSAFFAEAPPSIAPFVEFHTPSSDPVYGANVLIASYNVGPATNETDAYFQELDAYLRPKSYSAPTNGVISDEPSYLAFSTDDEYCGDLTAATYWNTYYAPNNSMRTGNLPLEEIETMVEEITRANSSTATISIDAAPTLPKGEAAKYFTPNAWSFRDSYQIFVGDTWPRTGGASPAEQDLEKITWVKEASAALKPFVAGNYINQLMMEEADDSRKSYEAGIFDRLVAIKAAADPFNLFRDLNYVHEN